MTTISAMEAVTRLTDTYGAPRRDNPDGFVREFVRAVSDIAPDLLAAAVDEAIRTSTFWPAPAEIRQAAIRIAAKRADAERRSDPTNQVDHWPVPTPEERERTSLLMANLRQALATNIQPLAKRNLPIVDRPAFAGRRLLRGAVYVPPVDRAKQLTSGLSLRSRAMTGESDE